MPEVVAGLSAGSPEADLRKRKGRSKVTNGSAFLPGIDNRGPWIRRCKDVVAAHMSDLGGPGNVSAAEQSIVRRCAVLTVELEQLESTFALYGEATTDDLDLYQRTANSLRRLLEAVGLRRRSRDVTPSLAQYLNRIDEQQTLDEEGAGR